MQSEKIHKREASEETVTEEVATATPSEGDCSDVAELMKHEREGGKTLLSIIRARNGVREIR